MPAKRKRLSSMEVYGVAQLPPQTQRYLRDNFKEVQSNHQGFWFFSSHGLDFWMYVPAIGKQQRIHFGKSNDPGWSCKIADVEQELAAVIVTLRMGVHPEAPPSTLL